jgi:hypothetical protein
MGVLAASAVVSGFDPGDDGDPELLAGWPALAVGHVLLEQGEERFHGGVVGAGSDASHDPVSRWCRRVWTKALDRNWLPRSECTAVAPGAD